MVRVCRVAHLRRLRSALRQVRDSESDTVPLRRRASERGVRVNTATVGGPSSLMAIG